MSRRNARVPTFRPWLEVLEDRLCPSLTGNEFQVNTKVALDQRESASAGAANGRHVVVWTDQFAAYDSDIKAQIYAADGHKVGGEITVTDTGLNEHEPAVAMDALGNFVVVWTVDAPSPSNNMDVLGARFAADGTRLGLVPFFTVAGSGNPVAGSGSPELEPSIAMTAGGDFLVTYTFFHLDTSFELKAVLFNADGSVAGTFDSFYPFHGNRHSSAAASPDGCFAVAYIQVGDELDYGVRLLRLRADLSVLDDQRLAGPDNIDPEIAPGVAMDNAGNTVVTYRTIEFENTTGAAFIKARRVSDTGAPGPEITVAQNASMWIAANTAVALDPSNDKFVVAYMNPPAASSSALFSVWVREVSASDVLGPAQNLGDGRRDPAVSIGGDHRYLVTYTKTPEPGKPLRRGADNDGDGVFGRRGFLGTFRPVPIPGPKPPPVAGPVQDGKTLWIWGDSRDNVIRIDDRGGRVRVTIDGGRPQDFTGVRTVIAHTFGGDDRIDYLYGSPDTRPAPRQVVIDLGGGNDTLNFFLGDPGDRTLAGTLDVTAFGDGGRDTFNVLMQNVVYGDPNEFHLFGGGDGDSFTVRADNVFIGDPGERNARLAFDLFGEAGADVFNVLLSKMSFSPDGKVAVRLFGGADDDLARVSANGGSRLDGRLDLVLDGGAGRDRLFASLAVDRASRGRLSAVVRGGLGDDLLGLDIVGIDNPESLTALIDGGAGFDVAHVIPVPGLTVRNCEVIDYLDR